jgi:TolA-binding protein
MKTTAILSTLMLTAMLCSCSEPASAPVASTPDADTTAAQPPKEIKQENQGVLTDTQRQGFNAANQMSDTLKKAEEERRKQMEKQGI